MSVSDKLPQGNALPEVRASNAMTGTTHHEICFDCQQFKKINLPKTVCDDCEKMKYGRCRQCMRMTPERDLNTFQENERLIHVCNDCRLRKLSDEIYRIQRSFVELKREEKSGIMSPNFKEKKANTENDILALKSKLDPEAFDAFENGLSQLEKLIGSAPQDLIVHPGSEVILEEGTVVGSLIVEPGGHLTVAPGVTLTILGKEININGQFKGNIRIGNYARSWLTSSASSLHQRAQALSEKTNAITSTSGNDRACWAD